MSQKVHHFYYTVHRGEDPEADPKQPPSRECQSQGAHTQYFLENSMKFKKNWSVGEGENALEAPLNSPLESIIWPMYSWKPNPG